MPHKIPRAICCKKSFWINRNGSTVAFSLIDFLGFATNHDLQCEFQFIISEILVHHNQRWLRNLLLKLFLLVDLLKELIVLWWYYINMTGCVGIIVYWSETLSFKEDIVLAKLFETFGSGILASFTELYCQGTDTFAFTLE